MANTTNFNWETPDDTDLVKDGAAAIRTLGSAIDTSLVDLKGGTTGQILSKATGTDMDFTWITNDVGDITAVSAGTGITGGGTTGAITITNDMATTITASGDIVVGTGSGTYDNLPIGTTGQVLTADTTVSPYKVKWAAPAGGATFVGCSLYDTNLTQSIANSTNVALTWNSEYFDTDGFHDTSSNTSRITIPTGKGGKYLLTGATHYSTGSTGYRAIKFKKNGGDFFDINYGAAGAYTGLPITAIVELSVGDYVELITVQNSGGSLDAYKYTATSYGWFAAQYLGA
jgi:hypothetical protein